MALTKLPADGDWIGVRQAIQKLATIRLGTKADVVFGVLDISTINVVSAVIDDALITALVVGSATISAGSFTSLFATRGTITTFACQSATISAGSFTSIFATRATLSTAVIKRLLAGGIVS